MVSFDMKHMKFSSLTLRGGITKIITVAFDETMVF